MAVLEALPGYGQWLAQYIVMMYYSLSPLFVDYLDLHGPDDLFLCAHEYDLEANRRFFFSSLPGELGMPTYGSGGYDWHARLAGRVFRG